MKKLLTSGLTLALLLGLTSVAMASTLYMDFLTGGEVKRIVNTYDLSQFSLGWDMPLDDFKVACNISIGTIDNFHPYKGKDYHCDVDTASILVKGGYALINERQLRLDVTAGFYDRVIDFDDLYNYVESESYYSFMLGFDTKVKFNETAWVDFGYSYSLNPKWNETYHHSHYNHHDQNHHYSDSNTYDLDSIALLNFKLNLLLTPQFGASLGYNRETIVLSNGKDKYSGITLGAFFKF